jgi:hypothetical protein
MVGVSVVFDYNGDFDRSRVIEVAKNARKMFEGLPAYVSRSSHWMRNSSGP